MKKIISILTLATFFLFQQNAIATPSPIPVVENTANRVIAALDQKKASLKSNPFVVYQIVDDILVPHIDNVAMSRSVLGRVAWSNASTSQRNRFADEFTRLVVRTYSKSLANYADEKIEVLPIRGGYQGKTRVLVDSYILRNNGPKIPVSYRLVLSNGSWKMYDMIVDGVSLLQSFRSQFANELAHGNIENLIARLAKQNRDAGY